MRRFTLEELAVIMNYQCPSYDQQKEGKGKQKKANKEDEFAEEAKKKLAAFMQSEHTELRFGASMSAPQRKAVHELADALHLEHASTGSGDARTLVVRKVQGARPAVGQLAEQLVNKGYVCLQGRFVNYMAHTLAQRAAVPVAYLRNRHARDQTRMCLPFPCMAISCSRQPSLLQRTSTSPCCHATRRPRCWASPTPTAVRSPWPHCWPAAVYACPLLV